MLKDLVKSTRSYRRFVESSEITRGTLISLIEIARFAPTGGNSQTIRFLPVASKEKRDLVFPTLHWAAGLKDWDGPVEGERPSGYIIILGDTTLAKTFGAANIAAYAMLLGAMEKGIGGCMLGSVSREQLRTNLDIPERYEIPLVVALGEPAETVIIDDADNGDVAYYRDAEDKHHVPKLTLDQLVINHGFHGPAGFCFCR